MSSVFWLVIGLSLAGGATCLIVFAATAPFRNRLIKSWQFYLLLVVMLRFIIPVPLSLPFSIPQLKPVSDFISSAMSEPDDGWAAAEEIAAQPPLSAHVNDAMVSETTSSGAALPAKTANHMNFIQLLPFIWLAGAGGLFLWSAAGYFLTVRRMKNARSILIPSRIPVYESGSITTPIAAGLFRPVIYLPKDYGFAEMAVRHELCHLRRGDIWLKWLIQLIVCVHWFNPLVYLMKRELNRLIELSCDRAVIRDLSQSERKTYGIMLLDAAKAVCNKGGMLVASLGKDKRLLQERLKEIMKNKKATRKAIAAMSVLVVLVLSMALLSGALLTGCTVSAVSLPNENDKTAEETDMPFVDDPDVIGTWEYVDTVKNIDDFDPANTDHHDSGYKIVFAQNGDINQPASTWSKSIVQSHSTDMIIRYEIKEINDSKYMFFSMVIDGTLVKIEVLKWISPSTEFDMIVDNIDLPFVNDPAVIGTWKSVNFVGSIDKFDPENKFTKGELPLKEMTFQNGGGIVRSWTDYPNMNWSGITWTNGVILDRYMMTASTYEIKEIDGSTYLFFEWKSGDYTFRNTIYGYYVLEKTS